MVFRATKKVPAAIPVAYLHYPLLSSFAPEHTCQKSQGVFFINWQQDIISWEKCII